MPCFPFLSLGPHRPGVVRRSTRHPPAAEPCPSQGGQPDLPAEHEGPQGHRDAGREHAHVLLQATLARPTGAVLWEIVCQHLHDVPDDCVDHSPCHVKSRGFSVSLDVRILPFILGKDCPVMTWCYVVCLCTVAWTDGSAPADGSTALSGMPSFLDLKDLDRLKYLCICLIESSGGLSDLTLCCITGPLAGGCAAHADRGGVPSEVHQPPP